MSSAGETTNGQGQSMRLLFDAGTLVVEGLTADEEPNLPGVKFDFRTRQFRAEAIWYRDDRRAPAQAEAAVPGRRAGVRAVAVAAPGRQGGVPAPGRGAEGLVGDGRPGRRRPADRHRQDAPGQHGHREGRPAHAGHHADHRPDEPVVRRADAQLRRRGRPARRRLLRHPAADRDDLRLGLPEHGPPGQPVRLHRLRRMPPPARPDLRPGGHLRHRPVPPGADGHARTRRQRAYSSRPIDRPDRLPPRDHPAPRRLPGRIPRDDLVCPVERRGAAALRAGARDLSRVRPASGHQHEQAQRLGPVHLPGAPLARGPRGLPRLSRAARAGPGRAGQAQPAGPAARAAQRRPRA